MKTVKKLLFVLLILMMVLPAVQREIQLVHEKPLQGAYNETAEPSCDSLSWESWKSGTFQQDFSDKLEAHIGFHKSLLRLYHQLEYSLFREAHAEGVVAGKQGELFEEDYIKAYMGNYYIGDSVWRNKAQKLSAIQDTLSKLGKSFFIILEPGKGSLYPDRFPGKYNPKNKKVSNYDVLSKSLTYYQVNTLDLNACFINWRDTSSYRLFPRAGTHWSYYGAALAADTMISYLRELHGSGLPEMQITKVEKKAAIRHPDDDIWLAMNVLTSAPMKNLAYPQIHFQEGQKPKLKALFVGDSFYFIWQSEGIMHDAFADCNFWYYNKKVWNRLGVEAGEVDDRNFSQEIAEADVIAIMITERFHQNFAWNFDEQLYAHFFDQPQNPIAYFANQVRINNTHFMRIAKDAEAIKMPLPERIEKEAEFLLYEDYQKNPEKYRQNASAMIPILMMSIRQTPEWLARVKEKAISQNVPLNEMIRRDASWIFENQIKQ
ncbi:MAG: hypothetical protein KKC86_04415 [Bacteroidetes bacterium]|nr:hypothetical protein [Bacteroidota bacterium]